MKILGLGPYIGNFEIEVTEFRPYARWLSEIVDHDKIFVFTHQNRFFLYDWIEEKNKIALPKILTLDELNQIDHRNKNIPKNEFLKLKKVFKQKIVETDFNCRRQEIELYTINYSRNSIPIPFYNKIFTQINLDHKRNNHALFIQTKNNAFNKVLLREISKIIDVQVLEEIDIEKKYLYNIKSFLEAKFVVCELSYWTLLCNIQQYPVFSWGRSEIAPYKKGGVYNFGNRNSTVFFDNNKIETILEMLDYFITGLDIGGRKCQ